MAVFTFRAVLNDRCSKGAEQRINRQHNDFTQLHAFGAAYAAASTSIGIDRHVEGLLQKHTTSWHCFAFSGQSQPIDGKLAGRRRRLLPSEEASAGEALPALYCMDAAHGALHVFERYHPF